MGCVSCGTQAATAAECVKSSNITIAMLADPAAAEAVRPQPTSASVRTGLAERLLHRPWGTWDRGAAVLWSDTAPSTSQPSFADVGAQVVFGAGGVLEGIEAGKAYVDMSTVDAQTSTKIAEVRRCGWLHALSPRAHRRCGARLTLTAPRLPLPATRIQAVLGKGGRFLEAPVSGSKKPAIDGTSPPSRPPVSATKHAEGDTRKGSRRHRRLSIA